jgi:hypothetical protein
MGWRRVASSFVVVTLLQACLTTTPPPPTAGFGAPYKGTGETIFVKDSRTDWTISEGDHELTAEQALEAVGDAAYEARRQRLKAHNDELYRVGKRHRRTATIMIVSSLALIAIGALGGTWLARSYETQTVRPATATLPEQRVIEPSDTAHAITTVGTLTVITGAVGIAYGVYGSSQRPPYLRWRIPAAMDRPAYIRQQVEPYNEKLTPAQPFKR